MFISPLTLVSRHHAKQGVVSLTKESFFYFLTSKNGILLHKWKTSLFYVNLTAIDKSLYILVHLSKKEPHKEQMYFKLSVYCIGWIEMLLCPLFGSHKIPVRSDLYITSFLIQSDAHARFLVFIGTNSLWFQSKKFVSKYIQLNGM